MLVSAVEQHQARFGTVHRAVATDRGFGSKKNETKLKEMGVARASLPLKGKKSKKRTEQEADFGTKICNGFVLRVK